MSLKLPNLKNRGTSKSSGFNIEDMFSELNVEELPPHLVPCLAYCALYPKNMRFVREILINQWLAEGFLSSTKGDEELEQIGNRYFAELCVRGVFQAPIFAFGENTQTLQEPSRVFSCVMHPLAHELACNLSHKEVCIFDRRNVDRSEVSVESRFVAFHKNGLSEFNFNIAEIECRQVRTYISLSPHWDVLVPGKSLRSFPELRVLDLSGCCFEVLPGLYTLHSLRYLGSSRNQQLKRLDIADLKHLQTLVVDGCLGLDAFHLKDLNNCMRHLYLTTKQRILNLRSFMSLQVLELFQCLELRSLRGITSSTFKILRIFECPRLESLDYFDFKGHCLEELVLHNCATLDLRVVPIMLRLKYLELISLPKLAKLPAWLIYATALQYILISDCENLRGSAKVLQHLKSLEKLCIYSCPNLHPLKVLYSLPNLLSADIRKSRLTKLSKMEDWDYRLLPKSKATGMASRSNILQVFQDGRLLQNQHKPSVSRENDAQVDTYLPQSVPYFSLKLQTLEGIFCPRRQWRILASVMEAIMWLRVMLRNKHLMKLKLFCRLFPSDYDFERDTLVELWMAMGFLSIEDVGSRDFDNFLEEQYILPSRIDSVTRITKYKVNFDKVAALSNGKPAIIEDLYIILDDENEITTDKSKAWNVSVVSKNVNQNMLKTLMSFHNLRALLFLRNYGPSLKEIPSAMFLALQSIEALDLSGSHLTELPSSIGNLRQLRYLDLSFTLLESLPESIDRLGELQTLKLRGCKNLHELPKNIKELVHLRHLDFDILGQLTSMPKGIGALTELRTLSAFIVDPEGICSLRELRNMNNLRGSCCISGLENVSDARDAWEARLQNKGNLAQLQLRWNNFKRYDDSDRDIATRVIDYLWPNFKSLQEVQISYYPGSKFPKWIIYPIGFEKLTSITLLNCENTQFCMSLGLYSTMKTLNIVHMDRLKTIAYRGRGDSVQCAFLKLKELVIDGMLCLETWTGVEDGDFPLLSKFIIKQCPKLTTLPFLAWLRSLQHLEITQCTMFESLPEGTLSTSVQTLIIDDCPLLKMRCSKGAEDWHKIEHVQNVWIDLEDMHSTEDHNSTSGSLSDTDSDYNGTSEIDDIQLTPWREDDANSLGNDAI